MNRSRMRERTGVTEIGLKSLGCVGFGILAMGVDNSNCNYLALSFCETSTSEHHEVILRTSQQGLLDLSRHNHPKSYPRQSSTLLAKRH